MNVCDLCIYNPPSSCDGKPCTMCPATTNMELEQEPSGDLISREAVYEVLDSMLDDSSDNKRNQLVSLDSIADEIAELPSVNPQEPKYCDRNICIQNEYNGIGCDECEVTKSQEPSVEIVNTEESNDNGTKYLNINVSDGEVKRNPDVVRLCSDVGVLEYVKPKSGHWDNVSICGYRCNECGKIQYADDVNELNYCCTCGAKMEK